jgi:hypothetical protein
MNNTPHPPHNIPKDVLSEVETIILQLRDAHEITSEGLMLILLKRILARLSKKHGKALSLDSLTKQQQEEVKAAMDLLIVELQRSGVLSDDNALLIQLKKMMGRLLAKEKEHELDPMEEKAQKEQRRLLKLFIIYEMYKVISPNQIAGETALENFQNNTLTYGIDFALKFSNMDEKNVERLGIALMHDDTTHRKPGTSFVDNLMLNKSKGEQGWER